MTRLPVLIAFLAGTLCGLMVSLGRDGRPGFSPAPIARSAGLKPGLPTTDRPAIHDDAAPAVIIHPTRNLFAWLEPPAAQPPPTLRTAAVSAMVAAPQPIVIGPPPFPYRYIGTFGTREKAFAVFAREGEVVNARVGDAVGDRFTLRRIGLESVDLGWDGPSEVRVGISAASSPPR